MLRLLHAGHQATRPADLGGPSLESPSQSAVAAAALSWPQPAAASHRAFLPGQPPQQILGAVRVGLCYLRGGQCAVS
jgi:hypothetical protein